MSEGFEHVSAAAIKNHEQAMEVLKKLFLVAEPGAVFGQPVNQGDYTVITAAEVSVGMGLGFGAGSGLDKQGEGGSGGGGGGGGASMGRPVAVITIGPRGVHVDPIVDVSKIVLAFLTALGALVMGWWRMRKASRG